MEDSYEGAVAALEDGDDFSAAAFCIAGSLLCDYNLHGVTVKGTAGLGRLDINVFFLAVHLYEYRALAGHYGFAYIFLCRLLSSAEFLPGSASSSVLS